MQKDNLEILLEDIWGKFDLVLEGRGNLESPGWLAAWGARNEDSGEGHVDLGTK